MAQTIKEVINFHRALHNNGTLHFFILTLDFRKEIWFIWFGYTYPIYLTNKVINPIGWWGNDITIHDTLWSVKIEQGYADTAIHKTVLIPNG